MPLGLEKEYINLSDGELVTLALKDKNDFFRISYDQSGPRGKDR